MGVALLIAANDVRRRLRNRSIIVQGVLAPLALSALISFAFGGGGFEATIGVVDADGSDMSAAIVGGLVEGGDDRLRFEPFDSAGAARDAIGDERLGAAIVVPAGFGDSLAGPGPPESLTVITDADRAITGEVAESVAVGIAARADSSRLAVATATAAGAPPDAALEGEAAALPPAVALARGDIGGDFEPASYFAPSMGMLFLFFTVGVAARGMLSEQRDGTLARLRSAPVPGWAVLAGKAGGILVLGLLSFAVLWGASTAVFGADWGPPLGVAAVIVAVVAAIAGIGALVAALARTDAQADGYTSMITFVLALLGGNFFAPGDLTEGLRQLSLLTPNGWALQALTDLSAGEAGLVDVAPALAVLTAIAAVAGGAGIALLARRTL